jgi:hypothetical protein
LNKINPGHLSEAHYVKRVSEDIAKDVLLGKTKLDGR